MKRGDSGVSMKVNVDVWSHESFLVQWNLLFFVKMVYTRSNILFLSLRYEMASFPHSGTYGRTTHGEWFGCLLRSLLLS